MTREEQVDWLCRLKADLNNGVIFTPWNKEFTEALNKALEQDPSVLADMLMEKRIRGELDSDITYSKDVIPDVKCKLTVSIQDHRPCYCGAGLREVWRESEE